jgi:hypothetical protein
MNFKKIENKVKAFYEAGNTTDGIRWLIKKFDLQNDFLEEIAYRDEAKPEYILMTTEGNFGEVQKIVIPKNTFEFPLPLILNLLAHEMLHVIQRTTQPYITDKNEREWQAYYEMLFHKIFPKVPENSSFHQEFFARKALEYYNRMEEGSALQHKYAAQKKEVEKVLAGVE